MSFFDSVYKFMGLNSITNGTSSGSKKVAVTRSGFLNSDLDTYAANGNTLASSLSLADTPESVTQTKSFGLTSTGQAAKSAFTSSFSDTTEDEVDTMANVFATRLEEIKEKRARPGLMQTRGEK